jgi:hypothetical protein
MKTIEYLKEHGLARLKEELFIKVKEYDEGLIVLNYDQIYSPKAHPVVIECRGLILDKEFNVVSRAFDRFFNYGEQPETQAHIDWDKAVLYEKVDGSLIRIYCWKGVWYIATRGTAFAESEVNGFDISFKDLVFKALNLHDTLASHTDEVYASKEDHFQYGCNECLLPDTTYICEITSMENRVVKRYDDYTLHYLAARSNTTFEYVDASRPMAELGATPIKQFSFNNWGHCNQTVNELKNLDEGFCLYQDGIPVCKIKSPLYVKVHLIKGEGLNPKRIAELVVQGEYEEYLTYYPEDRKYLNPSIDAEVTLKEEIEKAWFTNRNLATQKEYAMAVKDHAGSAVLFYLRKNPEYSVDQSWACQTELYKVRLIMESVELWRM